MIKLKRSSDRYLAGVCGGIAEKLSIKPWVVRVVWTFLSMVTIIFPGLLLYLILWIVMDPPEE
ncbi:MAG: PspC domain-containing protein [Melioribacteraceae bacterium]|nr:PspC domain-containing protein [Melioribacteraceae bacterium]